MGGEFNLKFGITAHELGQFVEVFYSISPNVPFVIIVKDVLQLNHITCFKRLVGQTSRQGFYGRQVQIECNGLIAIPLGEGDDLIGFKKLILFGLHHIITTAFQRKSKHPIVIDLHHQLFPRAAVEQDDTAVGQGAVITGIEHPPFDVQGRQDFFGVVNVIDGWNIRSRQQQRILFTGI